MASETITQADRRNCAIYEGWEEGDGAFERYMSGKYDNTSGVVMMSQFRRAAVAELVEALEAIKAEAQRENGSWVHLKRCIAVQATAAISRHQAGLGKGEGR